jgi:hypothetical protein
LNWICQLLNNHNLPILPFLAKYKDVGFNQNELLSIIKSTQLISPPLSADINILLTKQLTDIFNQMQNHIDQATLQAVIDIFTNGNGVAQHVDNQIKAKIRTIISDHIVNLTEEQTEEQINVIMTQVKSEAQQIRPFGIRNVLANILPDDLENLDKVKQTLTNALVAINKEEIQQDIVRTNFDSLGINHNNDFYFALKRFCDWQGALSDYTSIQFKELAGKTMADIDKFKDQPEIYSSLILNCSPYLTLKDIKIIYDNISQAYKEKLDVIINYCEIYGVSDEDPVKVLFINEKPKQILLIEKLSHLNPLATDITLEKIKLFTLNDDNNTYQDSPLNANNFSEIEASLPLWLTQSIKKQLTVANTVAKTIDKYFSSILADDNINISEEMKHELANIFYSNARTLGVDLNIPFERKKTIMGILKDQQTDDANIVSDGDFFSKQFAGVVETMISNYKTERQNFTTENISDEELNALPKKLIQEFYSKSDFKFIENMIQELEVEFGKYDALKDIKSYEIYHLLDIYFANLASVYGLGYHVGSDNRSFQRFRLYTAICLSQCVISAGSNLSEEQKLKMCREIKNLLFTSECAGQIANRLYGNYSSFSTLTQRMKKILNARMIA